MVVASDVHGALMNLVTEFGWRVDNGMGDRVSELFTEDCAVRTPHFSLTGKAEVHRWFSERAAAGNRLSQHFSSNFRAKPIGPDRYRLTSYALNLVGTPPAPGAISRLAAGTAEDEIVFVDQTPLFARRVLTLAFEGFVQPEVAA